MIRHAWRGVKICAAKRFASTSKYLVERKNEVLTPWYVNEARNFIDGKDHSLGASKLPELPANSPESLRHILSIASEEMGLRDLVILDRRLEDEFTSSALGPSIIVLGTGTSTKHLSSAGKLLLKWLKNEHGVHAGREGILSSKSVKVHSRRQKKRQQRQRMVSPNSGDLQRVSPWVAIDTKLDNIYVHLMTAERRDEIDLEHLGEPDNSAEMLIAESLEEEFSDPVQQRVPTSKRDLQPTGRRNFSSMPTASTREELALENLIKANRSDITENSEEVLEFASNFPKFPSLSDLKVRLEFFSAAASLSPVFSLKRVIKEAEFYQASGHVLEDDDLEMLLSSICYHGQSYFSSLSATKENAALWKDLCDYKAQILLELYDLAFRPSGRTFLGSPRLLALLYRTFTGMSVDSTTPIAASINPTPAEKSLKAFFDSKRLHPLRYLLESTAEFQNIRTVGMIMTSLANRGLYDAFWRVVDIAILSRSSKSSSETIAELALSLVVKTGDYAQIGFAIQTFLPNSILIKEIRLTPALVKAVEAGLATIRKQDEGRFRSVRAILEQYHKSVPQPN